MPLDPALTDLKNNALGLIAKPLLNSLASLKQNPTTLNVAAQGVALQGALIGVAPSLESLGIKDIATLFEEWVNGALATAQGNPATTPVATPNPAG